MSTKRENQEKPTARLHGASVPINRLGDAQKLMGAQQQAVSKLLDTIKGASDEYIGWREEESNDSDLTELRRKNFVRLLSERLSTYIGMQSNCGMEVHNGLSMPLTPKAAGLPVSEVEDTSKAPSKPTKTKQTKKQQKSPLTVQLHPNGQAKVHKEILSTIDLTETKGLDFTKPRPVSKSCLTCA